MSWYELRGPTFRWPNGGARRSSKLKKLKKKGQSVAPVTIEGRTIAKSFWGKSWCDNLERYSDYREPPAARPDLCPQRLRRRPADRQGRGLRRWSAAPSSTRSRSTIAPVEAGALEIHLPGLRRKRSIRWSSCCRAAWPRASWTGSAGRATACFRRPKEIKLSCSCPDWADMCKHVAAALYGVGARLDAKPRLLLCCAAWTKAS